MAIIASLRGRMSEVDAIDKYLKLWQEVYTQAIRDRREDIDNLSCLPNLTETVLQGEDARAVAARLAWSQREERSAQVQRRMNQWKQARPVIASSDKFFTLHNLKVAQQIEDAVPLYNNLEETLRESSPHSILRC